MPNFRRLQVLKVGLLTLSLVSVTAWGADDLLQKINKDPLAQFIKANFFNVEEEVSPRPEAPKSPESKPPESKPPESKPPESKPPESKPPELELEAIAREALREESELPEPSKKSGSRQEADRKGIFPGPPQPEELTPAQSEARKQARARAEAAEKEFLERIARQRGMTVDQFKAEMEAKQKQTKPGQMSILVGPKTNRAREGLGHASSEGGSSRPLAPPPEEKPRKTEGPTSPFTEMPKPEKKAKERNSDLELILELTEKLKAGDGDTREAGAALAKLMKRFVTLYDLDAKGQDPLTELRETIRNSLLSNDPELATVLQLRFYWASERVYGLLHGNKFGSAHAVPASRAFVDAFDEEFKRGKNLPR